MAEALKPEPTPKGMTLKHTLRGHTNMISGIAWASDGFTLASASLDKIIRVWDTRKGGIIGPLEEKDSVYDVAWSPDGQVLASGTGMKDKTIRLWDRRSWKIIEELTGHKKQIYSVAWSPDGRNLTSASTDNTVRLWNRESRELIHTLSEHTSTVSSVAWSPDGRTLASASWDNTVRLWNTESWETIRTFKGHAKDVNSVVWSPDGQILASASDDNTIRLWNPESGRSFHMLEGHTNNITSVSFSIDGHLLASKSMDNTVRLWRTDTWEPVAIMDEPTSHSSITSLAFHPSLPILATLGEKDRVIRIWELDYEVLLGATPAGTSVRYAAAKIVLVGEPGVGKTGLGWRLAHDKYKKHDSTHGQQFWLLDQLKNRRQDGTECEVVLWDLAGQPDYRLIHGLFLDDADLALVLFNPANQTDPLGGIDFWLKSLSHRPGQPCRIILVGARCDVGESTLTLEEIEIFCRDRKIDGGYIRTSAKIPEGIDELIELMKGKVAWEDMTTTTTTTTFKRIKEYVLKLKEDTDHTEVLVDWANLRKRLETSDKNWRFTDDEMKTAVDHLAKHGYVKILLTSQGEQRILLKPDLLNNLAASFVLEARRNPKGLGSLEERLVRENHYRFKEVEGLNQEERDILLDATMVLFIEHNVAFRESKGPENFLIFPELINQKKPVVEEVEIYDDISYTVSGATENLYAVLVVLLGYTNVFTRTNQWQHQAQYEVNEGEICGFRQVSAPTGEIDIVFYYCKKISKTSRRLFQALFEGFLSKRNVSVIRYPSLACTNSECGCQLERTVVVKQIQRGRGFTFCNECGERITIPKKGEEIFLDDTQRSVIDREQKAANIRTRYESALTNISALIHDRDKESKPPSCFISYAWGVPKHEKWVEKQLATDLKNAGIAVILDRWNAEIGGDLPRFVSRISKCDSIVVVATPLYLEKYENELSSTGSVVAAEVDLIGQRLLGTEEQKKTVRPVLLDGTPQTALPPLLVSKVRSDFREEKNYFATLFDLVLSLHGIPFDSQAVSDLREKLLPNRDNT